MSKILITGGLGYIGSHISYKLQDKSIIIDNLSNSNLDYDRLLPSSLVFPCSLNKKNLEFIFNNHDIDSVIHLASLKSVENSIKDPLSYYKNNIVSTIELLEAMDKFNINKLVFSSSATVYGIKNKSPLKENLELGSINPYGQSKIMIERMISDFTKSKSTFRAISLRYFNPIGANTKSGLSDRPIGKAQNLIPLLIFHIKENIPFEVFGNDYLTKDGTCERDYIHIMDLVEAHLKALKYLENINDHIAINIGLGKSLSVLEVIQIFERVLKNKIKFNISKRRIGDIPICYADTTLANKLLSWSPKHSYETMIKDAWQASLAS